ncbi:MAG: calcium-binding protein [Cyanobacteria bacterium J06623_5]
MTYYYTPYNYIWGTEESDNIHGTHGNDYIVGKAGDDVIYAGYGRDVIFAGEGNDTIYGGFGNDYIHGGEGTDTVSYSHWHYGLYADLASQCVYAFNGGGSEYIISIENIDGSLGSDYLKGSAVDNVINGLKGNDRIFGRDGNDTLGGQAGHDRLFGGNGKDTLSGGAGNDKSYGGAGNDLIIGGTGHDLVNGGSGYDVADYSALDEAITFEVVGAVDKGTAGRDHLVSIETVIGAAGQANTIDGSVQTGDVAIEVDLSQHMMTVENLPNNPTYIVKNFVNVIGTDNNDFLRGDAGANELIGNDGMDELFGKEGNDVLDGGLGKDWIYGGLGDDTLFGREGDDLLIGGGGNDLLVALQGSDKLNGTDAKYAGAGERDTLIGGTDGDLFILGDEHRAYYAANGGQDFALVRDFQIGADVMVLHGSAHDYTLNVKNGNTEILRHGDRIATVADITHLDLTDTDVFGYLS